MVVFDDYDVLNLAWVCEFVAEKRDDSDEPRTSVVFAALRVIESVKAQLTPDEIAEIEDYLQTTREFRFDASLWNADAQKVATEPR